MLTYWTKKILVEDSHSVAQLVHILQLVVKHSANFIVSSLTGNVDPLDKEDLGRRRPLCSTTGPHPSVSGETLQSLLPSSTSSDTAHCQLSTETRFYSKCK